VSQCSVLFTSFLRYCDQLVYQKQKISCMSNVKGNCQCGHRRCILSQILSLWLSLSISLSPSVCISLSISRTLSIFLSLLHSIYLSLSIYLSHTLSRCLSISASLSLPLSAGSHLAVCGGETPHHGLPETGRQQVHQRHNPRLDQH
jgi:hypothetical protein